MRTPFATPSRARVGLETPSRDATPDERVLGRPIEVEDFTGRAPAAATPTRPRSLNDATAARRSSLALQPELRKELAEKYRDTFGGKGAGASLRTGLEPFGSGEQVAPGLADHVKELGHGSGKGKGGGWDSKYEYKYKYKYKYKHKYPYGHAPWLGDLDCSLWKIDIHGALGVTYYPKHYAWFGFWFGPHPVYSPYWWCTWWPSYAVAPAYVTYVPTYTPTVVESTVTYVPYYVEVPATAEAPSYEAPPAYDAAPAATGAGGSIPTPSIDPAFAAELDALAANHDAVAFLEEGARLFKDGAYVEAADAFRKAMLLEKGNAVPKFAMAHALFALGEYGYASFLLRRGMELLPNWPTVGADLREQYGDPDDLMEHRLALQVYVDANPDDAEARLLAGYVDYFSGDLAGAKEAFAAVAEANPAEPVATAFTQRIAEIEALLEEEGVATPEPTPAELEQQVEAATTEESDEQDG